jgi:hypothetical protein
VFEPGLDKHDWETRYQDLEEDLRGSPSEALPELHRLVEQMVNERWVAVDDFVADDGVDPEIRATFESSREIVVRLDRGDDVDPGDIGVAIENDRALYEFLVTELAPP